MSSQKICHEITRKKIISHQLTHRKTTFKKRLFIEESGEQDLSNQLEDATNYIHIYVTQKHPILVQCRLIHLFTNFSLINRKISKKKKFPPKLPLIHNISSKKNFTFYFLVNIFFFNATFSFFFLFFNSLKKK